MALATASCLLNLKFFACEQLFSVLKALPDSLPPGLLFSWAPWIIDVLCHQCILRLHCIMLKWLACCSAVFSPITDLAQVCHQQCLLMALKVFHFTLPVFSSSSSSHSFPPLWGFHCWRLQNLNSVSFTNESHSTLHKSKFACCKSTCNFLLAEKLCKEQFSIKELEQRIPNTTLNHTIVAQS